MKASSEHTCSGFEINNKTYTVDFEKVNSLDDVIRILKSLNITFMEMSLLRE